MHFKSGVKKFPVVSSVLENDENIEIRDFQNQNNIIAHDGLQWKVCVSRSETSRLSTTKNYEKIVL